MSLDGDLKKAFKREKKSGEKAVRDAKRDVKRVARDIEHTIRPPWYRRAWNRVRNAFRR